MQNEGGRNAIPTGWKYKKFAVAKLANLTNFELTLPSLSSLSSDFLSKNALAIIAILAISPKTSISPCKNLHGKLGKVGKLAANFAKMVMQIFSNRNEIPGQYEE